MSLSYFLTVSWESGQQGGGTEPEPEGLATLAYKLLSLVASEPQKETSLAGHEIAGFTQLRFWWSWLPTYDRTSYQLVVGLILFQPRSSASKGIVFTKFQFI